MKIAVCIKRVPDTATKIRIAEDGRSVDPADVQFIMGPYDEIAVEEAIRIRDRVGEGSVTVICLGPEVARQNVRQALAMGADDGILIKSDETDLDPYQVGKNLAAVLADRDDDMVLLGRQAVDDGNGQVGPIIARLLGRPCVTEVISLVPDGERATVHREIEGAHEVVEVELPAVFTAQKGLNEPRYASLKGIMAAKKKPIVDRDPVDVDSHLSTVSLTLPPARKEGKVVGEGVDAVSELARLLREEAKAI